ncbi:efflux RND transporter periplasmic adaptor subunit [Zavarzinella formosa]|uniref:efflux RND transporter periplasmic adaptor subunit n=1 Tax=Zavarzinella formosa TaxID=360055 RepID=UPI0012FA792B|nr:efflux RND transporter periplasmic adaptor subunit [Zavarzinella formosa]
MTGVKKSREDWCAAHNVPESVCVECDPTLMPAPEPRGWCKIHGVPECTLCNPEQAQLPKTPTVTSADLDRARRALDFADRPANTVNCRTHLRRIQYATAKDADKAGIAVEPAWTAPAVEFVSAPGEVCYDQTRVARLSSRSPGTVWKVFKQLGQKVKAGDVLALIDAGEVGKLKAEVLQSFAVLQLKKQTLADIMESGGAVASARVREVEAAVREAEIRLAAGCQALTNLGLPLAEAEAMTMTAGQLKDKLRLLGLPADLAVMIDPKTLTTNLLPVVTPMGGEVVSRNVVAGEVVDAARILFEVADTKSLWLTLDLKTEDAPRVKVGQPVRFLPDGGREELTGTVAWRSSQADAKTRTVKVRADLPDPEGRQLANTFGAGRVILREEAKAVSVPNEAVHWDGCCNVVFVRDKDYLKADAFKVFHVRKIRIGARGDRNTEVIAGVLPGEVIVTRGGGLLLTELLRADLGEGCACCHVK